MAERAWGMHLGWIGNPNNIYSNPSCHAVGLCDSRHTYIVCQGSADCMQKCGKPCVSVAPSSREKRACDWGTLSFVQGASCAVKLRGGKCAAWGIWEICACRQDRHTGHHHLRAAAQTEKCEITPIWSVLSLSQTAFSKSYNIMSGLPVF